MESNVLLPERKLRELHLFAGAGGGVLGGMLLGHTCVCAVEIEPYCRKVIFQRQRDGILPKFPIWDDVRTFDGKPWRGKVDVVCGGFPCKRISPAATNSKHVAELGITHGESALWLEMLRIIIEVGPRMVFIENSKHLRTRGLVTILQELSKLGYNCRWCVLGAGHLGADHERERLWIKATYSDCPQQQGRKLSSRAHQEYADISSAGWWQDQPGMERVANGMAYQMDRLKAIGNGQVPSVAALAWKILSQ